MKPAETKAERLMQIEALLLDHPEGMAQAEIARRLHVNRSTINRYLPSLAGHIYLDADGRFYIDRKAYLVNVRLNLHEATAVHLATRLLENCLEQHNPHAASALRKLALALERLAPHVRRHLVQSAETMDERTRRFDPGYLQALEKLTEAWAEGCLTQIWYRSVSKNEIHEYRFGPYFIEPSAIGQSIYVFGWADPPQEMRTFKIERIERIELLRETYRIPEDFDPLKLLADAWGIWFTGEEPVEVVLKFGPQVARRVGETRWHRSEQVQALDDGSLLWCARIAEPQEMLPWIRGWGSDVVVLEPKTLRDAMLVDVKKAAMNYDWNVEEPRG